MKSQIKMNESNFFGKLQEIMMMDDFMDITLVCDDRTEFRAHRNILSAFSPVIRQMLQLNAKSSHPVVFLRGVKKQEMESILKFIYLGEVSFNQSRMDEFLAVADILEVRELRESFGSPIKTPKNVENRIDFDDFAEDSKSFITNFSSPAPAVEVREVRRSFGESQELDNAKKELNYEDFAFTQDSRTDRDDTSQSFEDFAGSHGIPLGTIANTSPVQGSGKGPIMYKDVQLFPPVKRKCSNQSHVWEHGGFVRMEDGSLNKSHVICRHCGTHLKYKGSPSNLGNHVERFHNDEWMSTFCQDNQSFS